MRPNILFITIDSLRADRCYGKNKTSQISNIESLINKGIYFSQNFVSSAQTITSLTSIFTGLYPIRSGRTQFNFNKNSSTYFDFLKNNNYHTCCCVPDLYFLKSLSVNFDDKIVYPYVDTASYVHLDDGVGDRIMDKLKTGSMSTPWIFYIHLMDLKDPTVNLTEFDNVQYGSTAYERNLSIIDVWLGKFLDKIDLSNTIVIISADHGKFIPITGTYTTDIQTIQKIMVKGKKIFPFLTPLGRKVFRILQKTAKQIREIKMKSVYTKYQMRSFNDEVSTNLYDELLHTPLVVTGCGVMTPKIITDMVQSVDIFPTLVDLIGVSDTNEINGRSLLPLINGQKMEERPIYIQSPTYPKKLSKTIGIRTSKFKYFRNRNNQLKNVQLYDLTTDSEEINNLAQTNPSIIKEMEQILNDVCNNVPNEKLQEFTDPEIKKITEELQKLGYMN